MKLCELPLGARIREISSGLRFTIAGHYLPGYPGTVLVCDTLVRLGCFDATEPNNPLVPRQDWGNNIYRYSNVRQWLNAAGMNWFVPQHPQDEPPLQSRIYDGDFPYANVPGFLSAFSAGFLQALQTTSIITVDPSGQANTTQDHFFLLSRTELGLGDEATIPEGYPFPLFQDFRMRLAAPTKSFLQQEDWLPEGISSERAWCYWLRTPYVTRLCRARLIHDGGVLSSNYTACGAVGIRPACVLHPEVALCDTPLPDGSLILKNE